MRVAQKKSGRTSVFGHKLFIIMAQNWGMADGFSYISTGSTLKGNVPNVLPTKTCDMPHYHFTRLFF